MVYILIIYRYLFRRSITSDGFFSADHLKGASRNAALDTALSDGEAYMAQKNHYEQHLKNATQYPQVF
jgi:hypothetical protein